jgi:hypothetical protein
LKGSRVDKAEEKQAGDMIKMILNLFEGKLLPGIANLASRSPRIIIVFKVLFLHIEAAVTYIKKWLLYIR